MDAKNIASNAVLTLTGGNDTKAAAERYYSKAFIQHSPIFPGGWDGLIASIDHAKEAGATYEILRSIGEGDMAVLHARVTGLSPKPWIMFNVYRIEDGKIAEHWEGIQDEATEIPSGRTMTDGPVEPTDLDRTQDNKAIVRRLIEQIFIGGDIDSFDDFFGPELAQHSEFAEEGPEALRQALTKALESGSRVSKLHYIVAEGDLVYTLSEGISGGVPQAFHDLFRVSNGKVAEHWDVVTPLPEKPPHNNGLF